MTAHVTCKITIKRVVKVHFSVFGLSVLGAIGLRALLCAGQFVVIQQFVVVCHLSENRPALGFQFLLLLLQGCLFSFAVGAGSS